MIFVMLLWQNGGVGKVRVWQEIARKGPVAKDPESHDWIFSLKSIARVSS